MCDYRGARNLRKSSLLVTLFHYHRTFTHWQAHNHWSYACAYCFIAIMQSAIDETSSSSIYCSWPIYVKEAARQWRYNSIYGYKNCLCLSFDLSSETSILVLPFVTTNTASLNVSFFVVCLLSSTLIAWRGRLLRQRPIDILANVSESIPNAVLPWLVPDLSHAQHSWRSRLSQWSLPNGRSGLPYQQPIRGFLRKTSLYPKASTTRVSTMFVSVSWIAYAQYHRS